MRRRNPSIKQRDENPLALPDGVIAADTKYPKSWEDLVREAGDHGRLDFLKTTRFGWCIATLPIDRRGRTYGINVSDGGIVTMGAGPHVIIQTTVYITKKRLPVLQKYVDLYKKGLESANTIRDRISSRRSQTVLRRANLNRFLDSWDS